MRKKRNKLHKFWAFNSEDGGSGSSSSTVDGSAGEQLSAGVSLDMTTGDTTPSSTVDWNSIIPEDLKGKEHFQNILKAENPGAELAKQFDNAQSLIGKRPAGIPTPDAPEEEWTKFFETARPKTAEEYEIKPLDLGEDKKDLAEFINKQRDPEHIKEVQQVLHKWGLTKKQAEGVASDYEKLMAPMVEAQLKAQQESEAQFNAVFDKAFGGDRSKVESVAKDFIKEHVPEKVRAMMTDLPNEVLAYFAAAAVSVNNKYEKQDTFKTDATSTGGDTIESVTAEMHRLMRLPGYTNAMASDNEEIRQKVTELSKKKAALLEKR